MDVFFIIFGWQQRGRRHGFVGPYTCPTCSWMGTFWLEARERRFRLYFIPIMPWRAQQYLCICRNCGSATMLSTSEGAALAADAAPLTGPDPFGPAPSPGVDAPLPGR